MVSEGETDKIASMRQIIEAYIQAKMSLSISFTICYTSSQTWLGILLLPNTC